MPPVAVEIRERVRRRLLEGELEPGQWVNMSELTRQLGVSATPVREALISLAGEGFLRAEHGRGFIAASLDPHEVRALYPVIWMLETSALREAPPRPTDLPRLRKLNADLARRTEDAWGAIEADNRWHRALLSRLYNPVLRETLDELKARAARYEYAWMRESGRVDLSVEQHERIVSAIDRCEIEVASDTLRANWEVGAQELLAWLEGAP